MSIKRLATFFFTGPFAERLLVYVMAVGFLTNLIFVVALRQDPFKVTRGNQYIFYGIMMLEYAWMAINHRKLRLRLTRVHPIVFVGLAMMVQGILVGLAWGNGLSRIAIDTINVLVVVLNVLYFSDDRALRGFDFDRLELKAQIFSVSIIVLGALGKVVNPRSDISLGATAPAAVALAILFAGVLIKGKRPRPLIRWAVIVFVTMVTVPDWNRTTLTFVAVVSLLFWFRLFPVRPVRALMIIFVGAMVGYFSVSLLPEDSPLAKRLEGLQHVDLSKRTGSIGEREAEMDAIGAKLHWMGPTAEILGAGHGAKYDVQYTWQYITDYSNAHYSWALFDLRWGLVGYVYLALWALFLAWSAARNILSQRPEVLMAALLCIWNLGYLGTYAYFTFFIGGLPFLLFRKLSPDERTKPVAQRSWRRPPEVGLLKSN